MFRQRVLQNIKSVYFGYRKYSQEAIHRRICIVGGGCGGINVAAHLRNRPGIKPEDITIFEPNETNHYQPGYTMIGGDLIRDPEKIIEKEAKMIPKGVQWEKGEIEKFDPDNNKIYTKNQAFSYNHLIIATGITLKFEDVPGLKDALEDENCPVTCVYALQYAMKHQKMIKQFNGGRTIFTNPKHPIKCAGAPGKMVLLTEDYWNRNGVKSRSEINYYVEQDEVFSVVKYAQALDLLLKWRNVNVKLRYDLKEVRGKQKIAVFENLDTKQRFEEKFDFLHAVPPMHPPKVIRDCQQLVDELGFIKVNPQTLQSARYQNIWSLGDSSSLPTSKTASAIFQQTPILVKNLLKAEGLYNLKGIEPYDGYTGCPMIINQKKCLIAEFKYGHLPDETFPFNQIIPNRFFFFLARYLFPFAYFYLMPKGRWFGKYTIFSRY